MVRLAEKPYDPSPSEFHHSIIIKALAIIYLTSLSVKRGSTRGAHESTPPRRPQTRGSPSGITSRMSPPWHQATARPWAYRAPGQTPLVQCARQDPPSRAFHHLSVVGAGRLSTRTPQDFLKHIHHTPSIFIIKEDRLIARCFTVLDGAPVLARPIQLSLLPSARRGRGWWRGRRHRSPTRPRPSPVACMRSWHDHSSP